MPATMNLHLNYIFRRDVAVMRGEKYLLTINAYFH